MSVKIMGLVWDLDLPANEKFVLLAYADHANHDGSNIFPAVDSIARKCSYSDREVQRITHSLEEKGFLVSDGQGPHGTNKWRFGGDILSPVKLSGVTSATSRGDIATGEGVTPMSPEPSLTVKEPSIAPAARPLDLVDAELKYKLGPKSIRDAIATHFKLTPNWEAKYNRQFMEWALDGGGVTAEKVQEAANTWRSDKRFNWQVPTLKGIQEHWLELIGYNAVDESIHVFPMSMYENPFVEE